MPARSWPRVWAARGCTRTFFYDGNRNLTKVTDSLARDTAIAYDGNDRISTITDSASRVWAYAYDGNGNLTKVCGV